MVPINATTTIGDIRNEMTTNLKVNRERVILIFGGAVLEEKEDNNLLSDKGISVTSRLNVVLKFVAPQVPFLLFYIYLF